MEDIPGQRLGEDGDRAVDAEPVAYVLLTILPETGEIEAYGPIDGSEAIAAVGRFEEGRPDRGDGLEPGVLVVPLRRPAALDKEGAQ